MPRWFRVNISPPSEIFEDRKFTFELLDNKISKQDLAEALKYQKEIMTANFWFREILYRTRQLNQYETYFMQLADSAVAILDSDSDPMFGAFLLDQAKSDFLQRIGQKYRLMYIKSTSIFLFSVAALAAVIIAAIMVLNQFRPEYLLQEIGDDFEKKEGIAAVFAVVYYSSWIVIGICISIWLSSMLRNRQITWDNIRLFDPDGFTPQLRFMLVATITFVFGLLVFLKLIRVGVGDVDLFAFLTHPSVALLIGVLGGLSEDRLTKQVLGRLSVLTETKQPGV